jgi:hypothetical protein
MGSRGNIEIVHGYAFWGIYVYVYQISESESDDDEIITNLLNHHSSIVRIHIHFTLKLNILCMIG